MININLTTEKIKVEAENYVKVTSPPLYQYDYGQQLYITGLGNGLLLKAHFFNKKSKEAITRVGTTILSGVKIPIPDELIKDKYDIHVFIYYEDGVSGKTIGNIEIPIIPRAKPDALFAPNSPSEQKLLEEAIKAVKKQVDEDFTKVSNQLEEDVQNTLDEIAQMYEGGITEEELKEYIDEKVNALDPALPMKQVTINFEKVGNEYVGSFTDEDITENVLIELFSGVVGFYVDEIILSGKTITLKNSSTMYATTNVDFIYCITSIGNLPSHVVLYS